MYCQVSSSGVALIDILINKHYPGGKGLEDQQYTYFREILNSLVVSIASN